MGRIKRLIFLKTSRNDSQDTVRRIPAHNSLKWRILLYMPIPVLLALFGVYQIGYAVNDLQTWYMENVFTGGGPDVSEKEAEDSMIAYESGNYTVYKTEDGVSHYIFHNVKSAGTKGEAFGYWLISFGQVALMTLWVAACIFAGGYLYYKREMEKAIRQLLYSAEQIADNRLDFKMEKTRTNELGMVCDAFEKMRVSLYETSQENFRILEERKRLNAAFAHDMRNPVTVLKGYADLLERYVPGQQISLEKELEIIRMVRGQTQRLENYVRKMSEVQKLEDITPSYGETDYGELISLCTETAKQLDGRITVRVGGMPEPETLPESGTTLESEAKDASAMSYPDKICIDRELVLEVLENLLANASTYAKTGILLTITRGTHELAFRVEDDGNGFSAEALRMAASPFYREEGAEDRLHFGLGLYICKLICEKCGGRLTLANGPEGTGGVVCAVFELGGK